MRTLLVLSAICAAGLVYSGFAVREPVHLAGIRPVHAESHLPTSVAPVLERACGDCHSNDTVWPWYSHVPPVSSMIREHVEEGRATFNFSTWASGSASPTQNEIAEICDAVSDGSMPPMGYRMMHPKAHLSAGDVSALCHWSQVTSAAVRANSGPE
jgi:hypothetical protein